MHKLSVSCLDIKNFREQGYDNGSNIGTYGRNVEKYNGVPTSKNI